MNTSVDSVFADQALDQHFAANGYSVRPFLGPAESGAIGRLHDALFPQLDADFSATILKDSFDERWRASSAIRALVEPLLKQMIPGHKVMLATFVTKRAQSTRGRLPLHQDWWIVDNRVHRAVHVWCPLGVLGPEMGCLKVVPGVHDLLNDPYPVHAKFRPAYHPRLSVLAGEFAKKGSMPAGSAPASRRRVLSARPADTRPLAGRGRC